MKNKSSERKANNERNPSSKIIDGDWTKKEDELILYLVDTLGCKWRFISKFFPNKSLVQIYNRFFRINPVIKKGRFCKDEDEMILDQVKIIGTDWKKISKIFVNRTAKQLRTRYNLHLKKSIKVSN